ncbi:MAG: hypothetical protein LJU34_04370, partial [Oscillospiraceae bacterium]|nr:hypothetical protein [Oscillospiraceae bacterium]
ASTDADFAHFGKEIRVIKMGAAPAAPVFIFISKILQNCYNMKVSLYILYEPWYTSSVEKQMEKI